MRLYKFLSGIPVLKNYSAKFMFISFLGIHIPLFGIIGLLILASGSNINKVSFLLLTIGFTLLATVITLFLLNLLIAPLRKVQLCLNNYIENKEIPNLPDGFTDEAGLLMRDVNTLIRNFSVCLAEKDETIEALSNSLSAQSAHILTLLELIKNEKNTTAQAGHLTGIERDLKEQLKLISPKGY
jgi:methyl-accepting chemotaxis protein